jgi:hypothetical protein
MLFVLEDLLMKSSPGKTCHVAHTVARAAEELAVIQSLNRTAVRRNRKSGDEKLMNEICTKQLGYNAETKRYSCVARSTWKPRSKGSKQASGDVSAAG